MYTSFKVSITVLTHRRAIECFLLLPFLAYNLFHAFFALNLKAAARDDRSQLLWARLTTAEFLHEMASLNRSP
jgi:hypothetical protein